MPGISRRREPHTGSRYLSQIVGERVRDVRRHRGVSQEELADRMVDLGHATWHILRNCLDLRMSFPLPEWGGLYL